MLGSRWLDSCANTGGYLELHTNQCGTIYMKLPVGFLKTTLKAPSDSGEGLLVWGYGWRSRPEPLVTLNHSSNYPYRDLRWNLFL